MCDTIEGLRLTYCDWLFDLTLLYKRLYKFNERPVTSIVLHLTTLNSASVIECRHGKAASYNFLEGIYANAVAQEVERFCVNPVMVVKSVISVKGNMTAS